MNNLDKALEYVRENIDVLYYRKLYIQTMTSRISFSHTCCWDSDAIVDLLEEYGEENDLPEGWWCEYGDIDDIVQQI